MQNEKALIILAEALKEEQAEIYSGKCGTTGSYDIGSIMKEISSTLGTKIMLIIERVLVYIIIFGFLAYVSHLIYMYSITK